MAINRLLLAAGLVAALGQPAVSQTSTYNWIGDHACIVESSFGLLGRPKAGETQTFRWTNFDKSFFVQVRKCGASPPKDWEFECKNGGPIDEAIKLSAKSRNDDFPARWHSRLLVTFPFHTSVGETFNTDTEGRFIYSSNGMAAGQRLAVFMASGTCTPFSQ